MHRSFVALALTVLFTGCVGPSWSSTLEANSRQVALALNDPVEMPARSFDPLAVPTFRAPQQVRPCCAFGMDMKAKLGEMTVPGYRNDNIVGNDELGHHGYGDGLNKEGNGIVYTCRGGFIDVAHIRDNADRMVFLTTQMVRTLPAGAVVELPDEGVRRRVVVRPLPESLMRSPGRWAVASALAEWANFQLSVWHEIVTWYGFESTKGFSEKVSAFSPEDLYSNVLGQRIAAGIIVNRELRSRDEYNHAMDAWITEALRRLGVVTKEASRRAMKSVDGLWWDSTRALPDWKLVLRRNLETGATLRPWLLSDAIPVESQNAEQRHMCAGAPPPVSLDVPQRLGDRKIEDLVTIELEVTDWIPAGFPISVAKGTTLTTADFPALLAGIRREGERDLGEGFDRPRAGATSPKAPSIKTAARR
ncbi:Hypothetical protein A7982_10790 [Minicystis rosea]|nr:Hypothetical protein A7982_10790 [Minicystis rosea]